MDISDTLSYWWHVLYLNLFDLYYFFVSDVILNLVIWVNFIILRYYITQFYVY